jgi:hypothetical protein
VRKNFAILFLALWAIAPLLAQLDTSSDQRKWPGSSHYPAVRDYTAMASRIRALAGPGIKVVELGSVVYDKVKYPVFSLSYTPPDTPKARVLLISGAHGDEPAGPEAVISFFKGLSYKDVSVESIPLINPWGWAHSERYNGNGFDVNRDLILFQTGEAGFVRDFTHGKEYDLAIDMHEASQAGAFIYAYEDGDEGPARELMTSMEAAGFAIAGKNGKSSLRWGIMDGVVTIPAFPRTDNPMFRNRSTIARYFNQDSRTMSYTFETSVYKRLSDRIACHLFAVRFLVGKALASGK